MIPAEDTDSTTSSLDGTEIVPSGPIGNPDSLVQTKEKNQFEVGCWFLVCLVEERCDIEYYYVHHYSVIEFVFRVATADGVFYLFRRTLSVGFLLVLYGFKYGKIGQSFN